MASITVNYTVDGAEWPSVLPILDGLSIRYDEDEGLASAPNGDSFNLSLYPRAGYLRCDSGDDDEDFCEAIFVLILNLPAPKGVRVIIQEDDLDEGISMELSDFIESIITEGQE